MDVANHFRTIWSKRRIVLAAAIAAAVVVFVWRATRPADHVRGGDEAAGDRLRRAVKARGRPGDDAVFIAEGYVERAGTTAVLSEAGRRSGLELDASEVATASPSAADPEAATITVTADGPSASDAAALSDAVAASLGEHRRARSAAAGGGRRSPRCAPSSTSSPPRSPRSPPDDPGRAAVQARHDALVDATVEQQLDVRRRAPRRVTRRPGPPTRSVPDRLRDGLLAFLVALILSAELVVAATALEDRFSGTQTCVTTWPRRRGCPCSPPCGAGPPAGPARSDPGAAHEPRPDDAVVRRAEHRSPCSASTPASGCTETAIELARTAAAGIATVLLVDGDMRRPAIHDRLGARPLARG